MFRFLSPRGLQLLLWLVIPSVTFAAWDLVFRHRYPAGEHFFEPVRRAGAQQSLEMLFLGNSRVACAIDPEALADELASSWGRRPAVHNSGMGWTTPFEYY